MSQQIKINIHIIKALGTTEKKSSTEESKELRTVLCNSKELNKL